MDFKELLQKVNIELTDEKASSFDTYYKFLIEYNEKVNLTAITDYEGVYLKHFYDSLILSCAIDLNQKVRCCDVGAGAGFPSVPNAICFPKLDVTIIDALNKRIMFLNELVKNLKLTNVKAIHARAEEYAKEEWENFDLVTARAVARLNILAELCLPLVKLGGYFIAMKGQEGNEEYNEAKKALALLGGKLEKEVEMTLPYDLGRRTILVIKKVSNTPKKYPRAFAQIKKSPLK